MVLQSTKELRTSNEELKSRSEELQLKLNELERINADLDNLVYTASHNLRFPILNLQGLQQLFA